MNLNKIILMNLKSRLDSHGVVPSNNQVMVWDSTNARFTPVTLSTVAGETLIGNSDIAVGGVSAVTVVDAAVALDTVLNASSASVYPNQAVLFVAQSDPKDNGVWQSNGASWSRATADYAKRYFYSLEGQNFFLCYNSVEPVIGTDPITFDTFGFQEALVSGTNIKTINGESLLGPGDVTVSSGAGGIGTGTDYRVAFNFTTNASAGVPVFLDTSDNVSARTGKYPATGTVGTPTNLTAKEEQTPNTTTVYAYGRLWMGAFRTGEFTYSNRVWRVYTHASNATPIFQTGLRSATGVTWDGTPYTSPYSYQFVVDVISVNTHCIALLCGSTALGGTASTSYYALLVRFSDPLNASSTVQQTAYYNGTNTSGSFLGGFLHDVSSDFGPTQIPAVICHVRHGPYESLRVLAAASTSSTSLTSGTGPSIGTYSRSPASNQPTRRNMAFMFNYRFPTNVAWLFPNTGNSGLDMLRLTINRTSWSLTAGSTYQVLTTLSYGMSAALMSPALDSSGRNNFLVVWSGASNSDPNVTMFAGMFSAAYNFSGLYLIASANIGGQVDSSNVHDISVKRVTSTEATAFWRRYGVVSNATYANHIQFVTSPDSVRTLGSTALEMGGMYDGYAKYEGMSVWTVAATDGYPGVYHYHHSSGRCWTQTFSSGPGSLVDSANFLGVTADAATAGSTYRVYAPGSLIPYTGAVHGQQYYMSSDYMSISTTVNGTAIGTGVGTSYLKLKLA